MSDQRQTPEDPAGADSAPETMSTEGLSPGVWVTGLIVLVLLLFAVLALA